MVNNVNLDLTWGHVKVEMYLQFNIWDFLVVVKNQE